VNDLQALLSGLGLGNSPISKLALAGSSPSAGSPRGAPPPVDPLAAQFRAVVAQLNSLAQALQRQGDQSRSLDIQEYGLKVNRMSVDRQNDIIKAGAQQPDESMANNATFPNIGGGGTIA